jgi:hypothetical protein
MQDVWGIEVSATLDNSKDLDFYALQVLDARTPIVAHAFGGESSRVLYIAYICPDQSEGMDKCSGSKDEIQGIDFCFSTGDVVGIERRCDGSGGLQTGTVLVGVAAGEFQGDCDPYGLNVFATYSTEIPVDF